MGQKFLMPCLWLSFVFVLSGFMPMRAEDSLAWVSVKEMKENYRKARESAGYSVPEIRHRQGATVVWADCSVEMDFLLGRGMDGRFYWRSERVGDSIAIILDSISTCDGMWMEQMKRQYGATASGALQCPWLNGRIMRLHRPRLYMSFVVSPWADVMYVHEGVRDSVCSLRLFDEGDYTRRVSLFEHAIYEDWAFTLYGEDFLFTHDVNRGVQANLDFKGSEEYDFLLMMEADGKYVLHLLYPNDLSEEQALRVRELGRSVADIPYKIFMPMYTSDGRVFPGRYYRGEYSRRGWEMTDFLSIQNDGRRVLFDTPARRERAWYEKFNILKRDYNQE